MNLHKWGVTFNLLKVYLLTVIDGGKLSVFIAHAASWPSMEELNKNSASWRVTLQASPCTAWYSYYSASICPGRPVPGARAGGARRMA